MRGFEEGLGFFCLFICLLAFWFVCFLVFLRKTWDKLKRNDFASRLEKKFSRFILVTGPLSHRTCCLMNQLRNALVRLKPKWILACEQVVKNLSLYQAVPKLLCLAAQLVNEAAGTPSQQSELDAFIYLLFVVVLFVV